MLKLRYGSSLFSSWARVGLKNSLATWQGIWHSWPSSQEKCSVWMREFSTWCVLVLRTLCPWIALTQLLLHGSRAELWCCSTSKPCVPAPPSSSLPAQRGWSGMPGQEGGNRPAMLLTALHSTSRAPTVCGSGAPDELLVWPWWSSMAFLYIFPVYFFLNHINFSILCQIQMFLCMQAQGIV